MNTREVQQALKDLGWPLRVDDSFGERTNDAITDFQRGFAWWDLLVDGFVGPKTERALRHALRHEGRASPNFMFKEFSSKGNGWIKVSRTLVRALEEYRDEVGAPVVVVSGYRDPAHNAAVGGAANSQHKYGNAADVVPRLAVPPLRRMHRFSGLGYQGQTGLVRHVDVRHVGPNTTRSSIGSPAIWDYA